MKLKEYLLLSSITVFFSAKAQVEVDSLKMEVQPSFFDSLNYTPKDIEVEIKSLYTKKGAIKDIEAGKKRILFPGGFGCISSFDSDQNNTFQEKYKVIFLCQGCIRYRNDDEEGYNKAIFEYLDRTYGSVWRTEIRKDALGLK